MMPNDSVSPLDPDDHSRGCIRRRGELKPICQIDHRDNTTAQIEHAGNFGARQRYARDVSKRENVLDVLDRQPEQLTGGCEGNVIGHFSISL
jgi:hypothetical protein